MDDYLTDFCRNQKLRTKLECPECFASGMDLQILKDQKTQRTDYDYIRKYQRIRCLVCDTRFIFWYDVRRQHVNQLELPEIDSVEQVEILNEEEKLARWIGG